MDRSPRRRRTFPIVYLTRGLFVAALLLGGSARLQSEQFSLSTYYPAPSGAYTNLITTGRTLLARDSGNVGVGTSAPTVKLDVNGAIRATGGDLLHECPAEQAAGNACVSHCNGQLQRGTTCVLYRGAGCAVLVTRDCSPVGRLVAD